MKLTIVSSSRQQTLFVSWLEARTSAGSFVIQPGHEPMVLVLSSNKELTICHESGKKETYYIHSGVLKVERSSLTLLMQES